MFAVVCNRSRGSKRTVTVGKYPTKKRAKRTAAAMNSGRVGRHPYGTCHVTKRVKRRG